MNQAARGIGRKPLKERSKRPDDALRYSVKHPIKVETLAILHEGECSTKEIAEKMGEPVKLVANHVNELYDAGCIEVAGHKLVGNHRQILYRAIEIPVITEEESLQMTPEERHDLAGVIAQGILAETVSGYRNGKLEEEENVCLMWDALDLDVQGRQDLQELLIAAWEGARVIHTQAVNRMAKSGEAGASTFVGLLGFERGRPGGSEGGYFRPEKDERS